MIIQNKVHHLVNYSQIMSPRPPLPRKVRGHDPPPPAPMGAPPLAPRSSEVNFTKNYTLLYLLYYVKNISGSKAYPFPKFHENSAPVILLTDRRTDNQTVKNNLVVGGNKRQPRWRTQLGLITVMHCYIVRTNIR